MNMQAARGNTLGTSVVKRRRLLLVAAEHVERIGMRIRTRREELKLSRRALAKQMLGVVTENDLYRWERGQHRPGDDKLEALAVALEVDVSYFMMPEPLPGTPDLMESLNGSGPLDQINAKLDAIIAHFEIDIPAETVARLSKAAQADLQRGADRRAQRGSGKSSGATAASRKPPARGKRRAG
jgi:transcriptional regulator with XRE-family HTH domain